VFWAAAFLENALTAKSHVMKIIQSAWQVLFTLSAILIYPKYFSKYFPEKIVGADLFWDLGKLAEKNNFSVYLLGGFGNTAEIVASKLKAKNSGMRIAGWSNKNPGDPTILDDLNRTRPDFLFIAFGPVRQETWIAEHLDKLPVKLVIGLGGTFDYVAGKRSAPPKIIRTTGLEWLYRLFTQPHRWRRIYNAFFGLIFASMRYKLFISYPYRKNAVCVIINNEMQVLTVLRKPNRYIMKLYGNSNVENIYNYWQFPQGGLRKGEDAIAAARREAYEEIGVSSLELMKVSDKKNAYLWNNARRPLFASQKKFKGQVQEMVYFKYTGGQNEIRPDMKEVSNYKWVAVAELRETLNPERFAQVKIVEEDLKNYQLPMSNFQ
jgi:exopolysaccharide biosynthesis WecB/TagA/CpsF family protein